MSLGKRLKLARERKKWSQLYVAKKIGITNAVLSNYERDYRDPDTETLKKLAQLYEVSVDSLLERDRVSEEPSVYYTENEKDFLNDLHLTEEELIDKYKLIIDGEVVSRDWTEDESIKFLEIARSSRIFIAFFLALTTGMRQGEILALKWSDIDFENKLLYVNKSLSKGEHGYELMDPKTASGKRRITLDDETIEALRQHRLEQNKEKLKAGPIYKNDDFVVASTLGTFTIPRNLNRTWYALLKKAADQNIKKIRFHELRHTHASYLLQNGIDIKVVSERLGHASVEITYNIYIHLLPNLQETAAKKINDIFPGFITKKAL